LRHFLDILLTAAHCEGAFIGKTIFIAGTQRDGADATDTLQGMDERQHPKYNSTTFQNDFILVKLSFPSTAPVSTWNTVGTIPADRELVTVIGFGITEARAVSDEL
jgi:Trypsin